MELSTVQMRPAEGPLSPVDGTRRASVAGSLLHEQVTQVARQAHSDIIGMRRSTISVFENYSILDFYVTKVFSTPTSIAGYRLGERLGRGKFGTVYRGKKGKQVVALKVMQKKQLSNKKDMLEQLRAEAEILRTLRHPHVIRFIRSVESFQFLCVIMEYANGGDLWHFVHKKGGLQEEEAARFSAQIADALWFCHERFVTHRDIKPENVLLHDGRMLLADFGLGARFNPAATFSRGVGSVDYSAPEVLRGARYHGPAVDVWSFGALLYFMVDGSAPFSAGTPYETYQRIQNVRYSLPASFSLELRDLISAILQGDPKQRPSMTQIIQHQWLPMSNPTPSAMRKARRRSGARSLSAPMILMRALLRGSSRKRSHHRSGVAATSTTSSSSSRSSLLSSRSHSFNSSSEHELQIPAAAVVRRVSLANTHDITAQEMLRRSRKIPVMFSPTSTEAADANLSSSTRSGSSSNTSQATSPEQTSDSSRILWRIEEDSSDTSSEVPLQDLDHSTSSELVGLNSARGKKKSYNSTQTDADSLIDSEEDFVQLGDVGEAPVYSSIVNFALSQARDQETMVEQRRRLSVTEFVHAREESAVTTQAVYDPFWDEDEEGAEESSDSQVGERRVKRSISNPDVVLANMFWMEGNRPEDDAEEEMEEKSRSDTVLPRNVTSQDSSLIDSSEESSLTRSPVLSAVSSSAAEVRNLRRTQSETTI